MTKYVKSANSGIWHFCTNCSKYPTNISSVQTTRPSWDLCDECKAKEREKNCS